ncbi:hypothetical protein Mapa_009125 [Marchantia paleacea]|nr:hypothetical protein Mapa_009125 [Marchantia paleacea]
MGKWTTGLCGCFEDLPSCCWGFWCPCVLVGRVAEVVDKGATSCCASGFVFCCIQSLTGCGFLYTCGYRSRVRQTYSLPETPCVDWCTDCWCLPCSSCQVYRELKNRGVDPAQGYQKPPGWQFMKR